MHLIQDAFFDGRWLLVDSKGNIKGGWNTLELAEAANPGVPVTTKEKYDIAE